ncbi:hypothetical protein D3C72_1847160 [compost metagenome]
MLFRSSIIADEVIDFGTLSWMTRSVCALTLARVIVPSALHPNTKTIMAAKASASRVPILRFEIIVNGVVES